MTLELIDFVTETEGVELEDFPPEVQSRINGALGDLTSGEGGPGNQPTDPPESVVVDESGNGDYQSIQAAIDEEGDSIDVIFVEPGEYEEDVTVDISDVTLTSTEGSDSTTISGSIFLPAVDTLVNDVTIDGFRIESGSDPAIEAETETEGDSQSGLEILNNDLVSGYVGAFLAQIDNATISGNTFTDKSTATEFLYIGGRRTYGAARPSEAVTIEDNVFEGAASRSDQPSGGNAIEFEASGSIANNDFTGFNNESGTKVLVGPSSELSAAEVAGENVGLSEGGVEILLPPETPGSELVRPGANEFGGDIEVTSSTLDGDDYVHITSDGDSVSDAATSGVWFNSGVAPTLSEFTGESPTSLSYQYYEGANNVGAAPDEVYLLIEDTDGEYHVLFHTSNDDFTKGDSEVPSDEAWLTRNVNKEIAGDPDPEDNPNYNWNEFTAEGIESQGSDNLQSLADLYGAEAELRAVAVSRGSRSGTTADVYFRNLKLGGSQYSLEAN